MNIIPESFQAVGWRVLGEPGVDRRAGEIGQNLGYEREEGRDVVRLRFADGGEETFSPHYLVPGNA